MFPILNVANSKGFNQMSRNKSNEDLKKEIDAMTPEQVMAELPLAQSELTWARIKNGILWFVFIAGIAYLAFGM